MRLRIGFIMAVMLTFLSALCSSSAAAEKKTALVIGNGDYADAPLRNPVNDAMDFAHELKKLGFTVTLITNGNQRRLEGAIREFSLDLATGGVGLFYFAGHGMQVDGENYLLPIDVEVHREVDVKYEALPANQVLDYMERAGNPTNIIILDACRNNPFARRFRSTLRGLAHMAAPTGSIMAYSTAPGSTASDGDGRNGVYTKHLLRAMKQPGLDINHLFMQVRRNVMRETKGTQTPWESSSLTGDFYFREPTGSHSISGKQDRRTEQLEAELAAIRDEMDQMRRVGENRTILAPGISTTILPAKARSETRDREGKKLLISIAPLPGIGNNQVSNFETQKLIMDVIKKRYDIAVVYTPFLHHGNAHQYSVTQTMVHRLWETKKSKPNRKALHYLAKALQAERVFAFTAYTYGSKNDRLRMMGFMYTPRNEAMMKMEIDREIAIGASRRKSIMRELQFGVAETLDKYMRN